MAAPSSSSMVISLSGQCSTQLLPLLIIFLAVQLHTRGKYLRRRDADVDLAPLAQTTIGSVNTLPPDMASKYILKKVETEQEMGHVMDVIWAANYSPYDPIVQIVFPVLGYTPADRENCLVESKKRLWDQHKADPSSNWFYVVEAVTLKPVGCCQWQIFTSNPAAEHQPLTAPWWPAGEHREFCELILNQIYHFRVEWMRRPYLALNWMAVVPEHRRNSIGSMLMKAGIDTADKLNLECWMEASTMGRVLYLKYDFRPLVPVQFNTDKEDASDVWKRCQHDLTPPTITTMWRPRGGAWKVDGQEIELPWKLVLK